MFNKEANTIHGKVYVIEPLGKDIIVNVKIGEIVVKILTTPTIKLAPGQEIWIELDMDRIHFFNKNLGNSII